MEHREIDDTWGHPFLLVASPLTRFATRLSIAALLLALSSSDRPIARSSSAGNPAKGSVDFLLAHLDAPNEFGLLNKSKKCFYMLILDCSDDGLLTPSVQSPDVVAMESGATRCAY